MKVLFRLLQSYLFLTLTADFGMAQKPVGWVEQYSSSTEKLKSVFFMDDINGWATGHNDELSIVQHGWVHGGMGDPKVFYTEKGGTDWKSLGDFILMGDFIFNSVHFVDKENGWIVCDGGRILHFYGATTSIMDVESSEHKFAAYPNPFYHFAKITFELGETKNVSLKVFDMMGREISILTIGKLDAGVHRYLFEGESLSSGNYLYKLVIGDQVETGKLILTE